MSELTMHAKEAKEASHILSCLDTEQKNKALLNIKDALCKNRESIFEANKKDLEKAIEDKLPDPIVKRLKFNEDKLNDVVSGIESLIGLADPVNEIKLHTELSEGLDLYRVTCAIGVLGIIFESRPDALVQIASLALKSGNAVLLKGGSEAKNTNAILASVIYEAGVESGLPEGWLYLITARSEVNEMLALNQYIDLIIPRGSNEFVQYIMKNTTISVLGHADGVCHTYIDDKADKELAKKIAIDAKTQYVSVCNATETILINRNIGFEFVDELVEALKNANVEIYGDDELSTRYGLEKVTEWHHEYLDYKVSMKLVDSVEEAVAHINEFGSGHSDSIITTDNAKAEYFMSAVDSGNVMFNCSTRFSDGFRYGFGAEVGVSTSKLHARGPVGLEGLVSYKYKIYGHGDIVKDFADQKRKFTHKKFDV
ncbi:MAG: glutamate-5-semialdehyde dehydrogenase [Clostridia bacterium]|nr:glutamate-5-semialdehyde dehydrogenase [Clostridia bacterium]